jgi:hypothetical protein
MKGILDLNFPVLGIHQLENTLVLIVYEDKKRLLKSIENNDNKLFQKGTLIDSKGVNYRANVVSIPRKNFWQKLKNATKTELVL